MNKYCSYLSIYWLLLRCSCLGFRELILFLLSDRSGCCNGLLWLVLLYKAVLDAKKEKERRFYAWREMLRQQAMLDSLIKSNEKKRKLFFMLMLASNENALENSLLPLVGEGAQRADEGARLAISPKPQMQQLQLIPRDIQRDVPFPIMRRRMPPRIMPPRKPIAQPVMAQLPLWIADDPMILGECPQAPGGPRW